MGGQGDSGVAPLLARYAAGVELAALSPFGVHDAAEDFGHDVPAASFGERGDVVGVVGDQGLGHMEADLDGGGELAGLGAVRVALGPVDP